ncbi:MAG: hypothetical protein D9V47_04420 [Clostridia bacterium]|nr:MAG: hypothetical protein D9V47_04420 [Clostridia bacterium]
MYEPELLEDLPAGMEKSLRNEMALTELTRLKVMTSEKEALVLTNLAVYLWRPGMFRRYKWHRIPLGQIRQVRVDAGTLLLGLSHVQEKVPFAPRKIGLAAKVARQFTRAVSPG